MNTVAPNAGIMPIDTKGRLLVRRGHRLFREGEEADAAYLVEKGKLEVTKKVRDDETVLAMMGPGDIIGEMALIDGAPRSASVRAMEDTVVLRVSKANFQERLAGIDPICRAILTRLSQRVRQQSQEIAQLRKVVR